MNKDETIKKVVDRLKVLIDIKESMTVRELLETTYSECSKHFDPQEEDIEEMVSLIMTMVLQDS